MAVEYQTLEFQVRSRHKKHSPLVLLAETDDVEIAKDWANKQWEAGKHEVVILSIEKKVLARKVRNG